MFDLEGSAGSRLPVKSADRTLTILETLAQSPRKRTLADLAQELRIPKSSLHGILRTLADRGWVEIDPTNQQFGLGVRALLVGASYVDSDAAVVRAQPVLDLLSEELGEATHLGRLDGTDVVYLAKRESVHPLRLFSAIGRRLPAHATALGKAILAERSTDELAGLFGEQLITLTPHTLSSRADLELDLAQVRARGYAVDNEENSEGIRCFSVALPSHLGRGALPVDALSVSIPIARLTADLEERTVQLLLRAREQYIGVPSSSLTRHG
jgi:DNA-binding IclR family transcriptional regulator